MQPFKKKSMQARLKSPPCGVWAPTALSNTFWRVNKKKKKKNRESVKLETASASACTIKAAKVPAWRKIKFFTGFTGYNVNRRVIMIKKKNRKKDFEVAGRLGIKCE